MGSELRPTGDVASVTKLCHGLGLKGSLSEDEK